MGSNASCAWHAGAFSCNSCPGHPPYLELETNEFGIQDNWDSNKAPLSFDGIPFSPSDYRVKWPDTDGRIEERSYTEFGLYNAMESKEVMIGNGCRFNGIYEKVENEQDFWDEEKLMQTVCFGSALGEIRFGEFIDAGAVINFAENRNFIQGVAIMHLREPDDIGHGVRSRIPIGEFILQVGNIAEGHPLSLGEDVYCRLGATSGNF